MWLNPQFPADLVTFTEKFISYPNKKLPAQFQQQKRQNQVEKTVKVYKDNRVRLQRRQSGVFIANLEGYT